MAHPYSGFKFGKLFTILPAKPVCSKFHLPYIAFLLMLMQTTRQNMYLLINAFLQR